MTAHDPIEPRHHVDDELTRDEDLYEDVLPDGAGPLPDTDRDDGLSDDDRNEMPAESRIDAHDILEAFNAADVLDRPGEPPRGVGDPADDADAPAP